MSGALQIVVLSKVLPYDGINHAGGEYVRRHVRALLELGHAVTVVAPRDPRNIHALSRPHDDYRTHLIGRGLDSLLGRAQNKLWSTIDRSTMPANVRREFRRDRELGALLRNADIVDVQWTEMMSVFLENDVDTKASVILVAHDVLVQREERRLRVLPSWRIMSRVLRRRGLKRTEIREGRFLSRADRVIVLSRKDESLIDDRFPTATPRLVDPPLWDDEWRTTARGDVLGAPNVVMVGAYNRPENHEAAVWLLKGIWPNIVCACPKATLTLVGARPSRSLRGLVQRTPNATATGYVESLADVYASATVAVAPLLSGAGIKFKSIDALLHGVPLVATSVGAEGIVLDHCDHPVNVHDHPLRFSEAVVGILEDHSAQRRAEAIAQHARVQYGVRRFQQRIAAILDEVEPVRQSTRETHPEPRGGAR